MDEIKIPQLLDGSMIKIIAMVSMLIDHAAVSFIENIPNVMTASFTVWNLTISMALVYEVMRGIGRLAFPIYCFLLVEGFAHTSNVKKYLMRLAVFAFISEVPFNLMLYRSVIGPGHQNVFLTLFIGLLTMLLYSRFSGASVMDSVCRWLVLIAGCLIAEILKADYGAYGILMICFFYIFREKYIYRDVLLAVLALVEPSERMAIFSLVPITLYNGRRGMNIKWFCYFYYPVHMLLLWGAGVILERML